MDIGKNIRKYRKELGLTQTELAEKLNTSQYVITNYERGSNNPLATSIPEIAKALNVPIAALFGEDVEIKEKVVKKSTREGKLFEAFKKLKATQQRVIVQQAEALANI